jgi:hypothetical protein
MPYSDPEKQKQAQAESYRRRYKRRAFRKAESARKKQWQSTEEGREMNRLRQERYRQRKAGITPAR